MNKTSLVYVLALLKGVSFKLQVRANYRKEELEFAKLDRSKIRFD